MAVFRPQHIEASGRLKFDLYAPTQRTNEVSVMRQTILDPHRCKERALAMSKPDKVFRGFAAIRAGRCIDLSHSVYDSRSHFPGHAHISLSCPVRLGPEPLPSADQKIYRDALKELTAASKYFEDPRPASRRWLGGKIAA